MAVATEILAREGKIELPRGFSGVAAAQNEKAPVTRVFSTICLRCGLGELGLKPLGEWAKLL